MMLYVYAVTDRPEAPLPSRTGLDDGELVQIVWRDLAAVASLHGGGALAASEDALWRHEAVAESLMDDRVVLPIRFGTLLPSRQEVGDGLRRAYSRLVADIERLRGHVEIGVRLWTAGQTGEPAVAAEHDNGARRGTGSAYLWAKVARERTLRARREARLRMVRDYSGQNDEEARESRFDDDPDDPRGSSAAFLVPRDRVAPFRDLVNRAADAHPDVALLCTGPWPPYSFVSADELAASRNERFHA